MKKIIFLLLITAASYGQTLQNPTFGNVKIKQNVNSTTYTKVNVQESDGTVNTIAKTDLQDAFYFASASNFPVTGITDKLYVARDNNILYRFNGTIYVPLSADISGKEDIANKQNSLAVDGTNLKYPTVTAVNVGLATKQNALTNPITGLGTTFTFPIFSTSSSLENSKLSQNSGNLFVNGELTAKRFYIDETAGGLFFLRANGVDDWVLGQNSGPNGDRNFSFYNFNTASTNFQIKRSTGNVLINTTTDNGVDKLQVNGTISALPATLSNQVVVKSQLDSKADLASPAFTGTPTAPTATAGTNTTQVATTAFVLANGGSGTTTLQNTYDNTANGTILIGATKPVILKNSVGAGTTKVLTVNTSTDVETISVQGNGIIDLKASSVGIQFSTNSAYSAAALPTLVNKNGLFTILGSSSITPSSFGSLSFDLATNSTGGLRVLSVPNVNGTIVVKSQVAEQLKDFFTDINNVGTAETDLLTYTTLANRLNATGEKVISNYGGTFNDVSASSQLKIYFGGTVIGDTGALTMSTTGAWIVTTSIMRTGTTTARAIVNVSTPGASTASYTKYTSLTGLTFTNTNIIKITGTATGATGGNDDITATYGNIIWQPAAL